MKIFLENEIDAAFDFDYIDVAEKVCRTVLQEEKCPFDCEINILITDNDTIRNINRENRDIDRETDVLSFPNLFFAVPADFNIIDEEWCDCIDPENDLVILGDIILSYNRILEQAKEYGHSFMREYAFLITHSMLHLCGYDHMEDEDAALMEERQRVVLDILNIKRD